MNKELRIDRKIKSPELKVQIKDKAILEVNELVKKFKHLTAVSNVSFKINQGERVAIVGANGAGKTTLIETIIGINRPTSGTIKLNFEFKRSPLEKIGVQFQDSDFPEGLNARDIIDFFAEVGTNSMSNIKINKLLADFQMDDFMYNSARSLSGGQRQKLNVFLAFVSNPELIFLDELTTGLDIKVRNVITTFVHDYITKNESTLVVVSHNSAEIEWLCNRIIAMQKGEVKFDGSIEEAKAKYGDVESLMNSFI